MNMDRNFDSDTHTDSDVILKVKAKLTGRGSSHWTALNARRKKGFAAYG